MSVMAGARAPFVAFHWMVNRRHESAAIAAKLNVMRDKNATEAGEYRDQFPIRAANMTHF
ncbi:hypothetical protein [Gluconacetobacter takamatsuzukensis]|uniref:Uncharacterized protein n=1 Tax=Gluconacetobacter takamatsuzukensis TaxID=1286190 RepID=A0A7W4KBH4_9PROT|nr:hypothetical protein [Gluconacetobacter takamatsuzukensis]MBB2203868.1 hypothetical protein [Gluconacetobacter takamatsuzukensis]